MNVQRTKTEAIARGFVGILCATLMLTAGAKVLSVIAGSSGLLQIVDPLFALKFDYLLLAAAALEVGVAAICILRPVVEGLVALAWLSLVFLAYRIGLWSIGWQKPCGCLGNLTDALNISPQLADNFMKSLLIFMFVGSISLLLLNGRERVARATADSAGTGGDGEGISSI